MMKSAVVISAVIIGSSVGLANAQSTSNSANKAAYERMMNGASQPAETTTIPTQNPYYENHQVQRMQEMETQRNRVHGNRAAYQRMMKEHDATVVQPAHVHESMDAEVRPKPTDIMSSGRSVFRDRPGRANSR